jgi:hypothetical protein
MALVRMSCNRLGLVTFVTALLVLVGASCGSDDEPIADPVDSIGAAPELVISFGEELQDALDGVLDTDGQLPSTCRSTSRTGISFATRVRSAARRRRVWSGFNRTSSRNYSSPV